MDECRYGAQSPPFFRHLGGTGAGHSVLNGALRALHPLEAGPLVSRGHGPGPLVLRSLAVGLRQPPSYHFNGLDGRENMTN